MKGILANFSWLKRGKSMMDQSLFKALYLSYKCTDGCGLEIIDSYVAQSMNFFTVSPMASKETAVQSIEMTLSKKDFQKKIYDVLHEDNFDPAKLIASVAFIFRKILVIHFTNRDCIEEDEFQKALYEEVAKAKEEIIKTFPEIEKQFQLFMDHFTEKYMSPWNPERYSNYQSKANFGTGIDYISNM